MPLQALTFANNVPLGYSDVDFTYQGRMDYTISTPEKTRLIVRLAYGVNEYDLEYTGWPAERCELLAQMAVLGLGCVGVLTDGWRWLFARLDGGRVTFSGLWDLRRGEVGVVVAALVACFEGVGMGF